MHDLSNAIQTMSSREIAELTGKRHDNVVRDTEKMLLELEIDPLSFEEIYPDSYGRQQKGYSLTKDLTITLVSGYSVQIRHRIVTRWQELEQASSPQPLSPKIPQTFAEALRLAATMAEEVEAQKLLLTEQAPKVEFHDQVASAINGQTVQEVAKVLGTGQKRLFAWLRDQSILMANNLPYQSSIESGHCRVVEKRYIKRGEVETYTQTLITGKGLTYIQKRFKEATK